MARPARPPLEGSAFFSYGFRPFFLSAALFAVVVMPAWLLILAGQLELSGPFVPVDWHIHEMLFGYGSAVLTGFLFTAVPSWTGRRPIRGLPLALLLGLWVMGRLAIAGVFPLEPVAVLLIDASFLTAVLGLVSAEVAAGQDRRNLIVLIPILAFLAANIIFHLEAQAQGLSDVGRRLGFSVIVFLIMLIGGRIIPAFTRNWLSKRGADRIPVPFGRFDGLTLFAGIAAQALWTARPFALSTGVALLAAAALHAVRVTRWQGIRTLASPLLAMLHVAYAFIPLGLAVLGLTALTEVVPPAAGLHLLGIGAIGGMTLAVMMRASMGHTGQALVAGPALTAAFVMVMFAAVLRAAVGPAVLLGLSGTTLAALLWIASFGLFLARLGPSLLRSSTSQAA